MQIIETSQGVFLLHAEEEGLVLTVRAKDGGTDRIELAGDTALALGEALVDMANEFLDEHPDPNDYDWSAP